MIIDRFEADFAVCEKHGREMVNIPIADLPTGSKPGDVINIIDGEYVINPEETKKRKEDVQNRFSKLFKKQKNINNELSIMDGSFFM